MVDLRPAGVRQPEEFADLVERLADRVVDRAAQAAVAAQPFHRHALAMPARQQQQQIGERRPALH